MGKGPQTSLREGSEGVITSISLHPGRTTLPLSWAEEREVICLKDGPIRVLSLSEENFWLSVLFHSEVLCRCLPLQPCSGTPSLSSECVSVFCPLPTVFSAWWPCRHRAFSQPHWGPPRCLLSLLLKAAGTGCTVAESSGTRW